MNVSFKIVVFTRAKSNLTNVSGYPSQRAPTKLLSPGGRREAREDWVGDIALSPYKMLDLISFNRDGCPALRI